MYLVAHRVETSRDKEETMLANFADSLIFSINDCNQRHKSVLLLAATSAAAALLLLVVVSASFYSRLRMMLAGSDADA